MCYVCGKSSNKIVHTEACRYVKMIPVQNRRYFVSLKEAEDAGYMRCKYCSHISKYMTKERKDLVQYCKANGLCYVFNRIDGSLDIVSRSGNWKIIVNGQKHFIWLYHKNIYHENDQRGMVPGYHSQKVRKSTLMGYMYYIADHDHYKMKTPLDQRQMTAKGRKAKKQQERHAEKVKRIQSIRYVRELLDKMSDGVIDY